ncbi:MAG: HupE/UreJ family protein [Rhodospirillales bacterium]|nr:HupE/UreJ family protein [Rhodospirillales bacterium]
MVRTFALGFISTIVLAVVLLATGPAAAHTFGGAADGGFYEGFIHPFLGLDHMLAMVAVGLWAAHLGGSARLRVPATFVTVMAAGGIVGAAGISISFVEAAIALSVVALGGLVMARVRMPLAAGMALVGAFAIFHGHAHGAEIPDAASPAVYALGFALATAVLHGVGLTAGIVLGRTQDAAGIRALRIAGGGIATAGVFLLVM